MKSTKKNFKILPTYSPPLPSKNTLIRRANTLLHKSLNTDENKQDLNKFVSNTQIDFTSKNHPYRECITHNQSFEQPSVDFKSMSMTDIKPAVSIENIPDEYQEQINQTLKYLSNVVLSSEDEDDREVLSNGKLYVDQASQVILGELKVKKKIKSKKSRASSKRSKTSTSKVSIPPSTLTVPSPTRMPTTNELTTSIKVPVSASASVTKSEETNGSKSLITVDTTKARSNLEVVRLCLRELGWKECSINPTGESDIYWHSSSYLEGNPSFPFTTGRVNKFPGMNELLRKVHLTRLLNNMRSLFPNEYNFYPKTWFLPEQNQQFKDDVRYIHNLDRKHNQRLTTFIVKPSDGSQGEGIYLLRDPSHIITTNRPHVIQEYIDRPLLMNGLKFDLRIYVLILNLYPLEVFLYDEGLVRFATVNYKSPSIDNLHVTYMHLTNYSLNKRSINYKHPIDDKQTDGSKRKLTIVWKELSQIYGPEKIERTKHLIIDLINKTILAFLPELRVEYEFELPIGKRENLSCFQIIGFDIILTDQLKPILLEVNSNPSLRIDFDKNESGKVIYQPSLIDEEIKKPLVLETLKLALPKKKLNTIARHAQIQADDELMAQRYEKLAQRRVEERSEKLKNERKTRFDIRLNPFFSRPVESVSKEVSRQQQEQQFNEQKKIQQSSSTHPFIAAESNEFITAYTQFNNLNHSSKSTKYIHKVRDERDESVSPTGTKPMVEIPKRSSNKSGPSRFTSSDAAMIRSINSLKLIFSPNHKTKYENLLVLDQISQIYIQFVVNLGYKTMTGGQFRHFASLCGIINETITAPSIDILYFQMLKKMATICCLPFTAFIEAFFLLSQRKFPNAHHLSDSVKHLLHICNYQLTLCVQTSTAPSTPYPRSHKTPASSLNIRPSNPTVRSSTTVAMNHQSRKEIIPASTPLTKPHENSLTSNPNDDKTKEKISRQATKSVFPLFFDVL